MKKFILSLVAFCGISLIFFSCGKKEIENVRGKVFSVHVVSDSVNGDRVTAMRLLSGTDTLLFKMVDARYINGIMFANDSVSVDYIQGRGDTLRALIVNVLPGASHIIELGKPTSDTLMTAPEMKPMPEERDTSSAKKTEVKK
jgi:hypothetical protein